MMKEVLDSNFKEEVQNQSGVVVVDFWASWCGPCKMLSPVIEELSNEVTTAKFAKVNVDENPQSSQNFNIASIPTLLVFKDGKVVDTMVGFRPKAELEQLVKKHI
ncbi:thioredoxin [Clostridium algidicarnis]|mgnify:CR=1 FL=1|uniref:Thioredoxin n=2 Tax=Clostridium algidicarnis TaxID=37659 RepID=A0A2S6FY99_9CLOT|nr:thioredoxin [Clostridium algidicarnis]MBB6631816.1 thioredoxin [Clostridium algidicarnis]MBB6698128.1 thioredoxin [Clostridium algidicarnis]MBU3192518.1 thioredoxin [Clostridium algidicarnis]MBU3204299.1 thioredoxin [Clostridium algidicarnis]MBU3207013.1 thioredoxin [Clostridium algidicarnis]